MPARAHINPAMLRWARDRVGFDLQAAAKAAHVKPEQLERWEQCEDRPTFKQAQDPAQALRLQAWYADHQREQGAELLAFVGRLSQRTDPRTVAADIRQVLGAQPAKLCAFAGPVQTV